MFRRLLVVASSAFVVAASSVNPGFAVDTAPSSIGEEAVAHLASAFGRTVIDGQQTFLHVTVAGFSEAGAAAAARAELDRRGAAVVDSAQFTKNGTWSQFKDSSLDNDRVDLYWSSYGSGPNYLLDGGDLSIAAEEWNLVASSSFVFSYADSTSQCPSLVDECPGDQGFNGRNEVGWADLGGYQNGGITLGVTWFNFRTRGGPFAAPQEADMALSSNSDVIWDTPGGFETHTVAAHELGHMAGLGHSSDTDALMYAWYQDAGLELLGADDIAGISALYPVSADGSGDSGGVPGYCKKHPEREGCP